MTRFCRFRRATGISVTSEMDWTCAVELVCTSAAGPSQLRQAADLERVGLAHGLTSAQTQAAAVGVLNPASSILIA